jgi:hypothetical protein
MTMLSQEKRVELDYRESDGIEVLLLWNRSDGSLSVAVHDTRTATSFELLVDPEQAGDAFRHPFAYAAFTGVLPDEQGSDAVKRAVDELEGETLSLL